MKSGKMMVTKFEHDRNVSRGIHEKKFLQLPLIQSLFDEPQNGEIHRSIQEQGRLLFCSIEDLSYKKIVLGIIKTKDCMLTTLSLKGRLT